MARFPADSDSRRIETRSYAIVFYQLNYKNWEFRYSTGRDIGTDCSIELSQDNKWTSRSLSLQVKGTGSIGRYEIKDGSFISYPFEVKTICYALESTTPFVFVVVDVNQENAYFTEVHEHFLAHKELFEKLESGQETIHIHMPKSNLVAVSDARLQSLAFCLYSGGASRELHRIESAEESVTVAGC